MTEESKVLLSQATVYEMADELARRMDLQGRARCIFIFETMRRSGIQIKYVKVGEPESPERPAWIPGKQASRSVDLRAVASREPNARRGYAYAHRILHQTRGKAAGCVFECQASAYQWANLTGNYSDPWDYAQMCATCHRRYDQQIRIMMGGSARSWNPAEKSKTQIQIDTDVAELAQQAQLAGWPAHDPSKLYQRYLIRPQDRTALGSAIRRAAKASNVSLVYYKDVTAGDGLISVKFHVAPLSVAVTNASTHYPTDSRQ
jgi:hypothetical protein